MPSIVNGVEIGSISTLFFSCANKEAPNKKANIKLVFFLYLVKLVSQFQKIEENLNNISTTTLRNYSLKYQRYKTVFKY